MPFRDEESAARDRALVLEQKLASAEAEIARLRGGPGSTPADEPDAEPARPPWARPTPWAGATVVLLATGVFLQTQGLMGSLRLLLPFLGGAILLSACVTAATIALTLRVVAGPNTILVISGGQRGVRILGPGSVTLPMPIIERVDRMDLRPIEVTFEATNAYTRGGRPITLRAKASVGIARAEPDLRSAVERFLGAAREQIGRVAGQTLEGVTRGAVAERELAELEADPERFDQHVIESAARDLAALGLRIDSLSIRVVP